MRRRHAMPFGATVQPAGGVLFRLWAPAARRVDLCLEGLAELPMQGREAGWFELFVADAAAGSRYRYRIDGGLRVPDPSSRYNPDDVHGPSEVIDPAAFLWQDGEYCGRPWFEAIIYELHVGTFTPAGSFAAVEARLDYLASLGVTALALMRVADFPGHRNWGYDGALLFAPDASYGRPEDLKRLVQAAHARGLMVFLDVVYNHFGPDGNYLALYAPGFFNQARQTPWGAAINFDGPDSATVRDFFIHNALYWLEEFHFDGLRLDAIHAIQDKSSPDIVVAISQAVRAAFDPRQVHLILENDHNEVRYLTATEKLADAQWNDDIHHVWHVLLSGERDGYYADYAAAPMWQLGRCLTSGFAYQGEVSPFRDGRPRGTPSGHLSPGAFVDFLQNHDQIGNRAFGERLEILAPAPAIEAALAVLLLSPHPPMLFMGEEFAATSPFLFFCDFASNPALAEAVTSGRRREFAGFKGFADPALRQLIPDPGAATSFLRCQLDWACLERPPHSERFALVRQLLALRQRWIIPVLRTHQGALPADFSLIGQHGLRVRWHFSGGVTLYLMANLGPTPLAASDIPAATLIFQQPEAPISSHLPAWSVLVLSHRRY